MLEKTFVRAAGQPLNFKGLPVMAPVACLSLFLVLLLTPVARAERQTLQGHVPPAVGRVQPLERLHPARSLDLAIGLPLRNREALTNVLKALYDPASPSFRHYLTPEDFTARFGPSEQDYEALAAFMSTNGLTVTARHPNRLLLDVNGAVAAIERTFHVSLKVYPHPEEARTFYAPDTEPSLDLAVPVLHIGGLNNYRLPRPAMLRQSAAPSRPKANVGSGPSGSYMGRDFRAAYAPGVSLDGTGQAVGLLEFDGFYAGDITSYETRANLPNVPVQIVKLDGFNGVPTPGHNSGNGEVALDIQMVISMAPGLSKVIVYEAGPMGSGNDILNRMATDNQAKQLSSSWTWSLATDGNTSQILQEIAAQGQSFFNASGDSNAWTGPIDPPADNPYATIVGGTTVTTSGAGGAWLAETVWNWGSGTGSGGGISTTYGIPSWQQGVSMAANQGSTTSRNIPDVAMVADNVFSIADNGKSYPGTGGTSCATPLWAGFAALINQQAAASGKPPVGFLNPALYAIGTGPQYASAFHDIVTGNNTSRSSPNKFYAVAGYDLCTGWGTPTGSNLINALVAPAYPPNVVADGWALVAESCLPTNGAVNPGETVTVSFGLRNIGLGDTTNLVATLLSTNGVTVVSAPQSYGLVPAGGQTLNQSFTFIANGACGSAIAPLLQLQDGATSLGTVSYSMPLGLFSPSTVFAQGFDDVTAPALPAGWNSAASGGGSNWVTSTALSDTAPNSAYEAEPRSRAWASWSRRPSRSTQPPPSSPSEIITISKPALTIRPSAMMAAISSSRLAMAPLRTSWLPAAASPPEAIPGPSIRRMTIPWAARPYGPAPAAALSPPPSICRPLPPAKASPSNGSSAPIRATTMAAAAAGTLTACPSLTALMPVVFLPRRRSRRWSTPSAAAAASPLPSRLPRAKTTRSNIPTTSPIPSGPHSTRSPATARCRPSPTPLPAPRASSACSPRSLERTTQRRHNLCRGLCRDLCRIGHFSTKVPTKAATKVRNQRFCDRLWLRSPSPLAPRCGCARRCRWGRRRPCHRRSCRCARP